MRVHAERAFDGCAAVLDINLAERARIAPQLIADLTAALTSDRVSVVVVSLAAEIGLAYREDHGHLAVGPKIRGRRFEPVEVEVGEPVTIVHRTEIGGQQAADIRAPRVIADQKLVQLARRNRKPERFACGQRGLHP